MNAETNTTRFPREPELVLVRPDGYLAASARLQQPEPIEPYLLKLTRHATNGDVTSNGGVEEPR
jgi:hypothetical protein